MNVLCNTLYFPSSEKIKFIYFGDKKPPANRTPHEHYDYLKPFPEFVEEIREKHRIEAVFIFSPENNFLPPALEHCDIPLFAFVSDWNLGYFSLVKNLSRFDFIFTDKGGVEVFKKLGQKNVFHWNMYGFLPEQYPPAPPRTKRAGCGFLWEI